jgi:hypothetical protein
MFPPLPGWLMTYEELKSMTYYWSRPCDCCTESMEVLEGIFVMRNFKQCIATTSNDPKRIIEQGWMGWFR